MDLRKVKKTYVKSSLNNENTRKTKSKKRSKKSQLFDTPSDSFWTDSFDKLLDDKNILRENNVLKKKIEINAEFNRDSSLDETNFKQTKVKKKKSVKEFLKWPQSSHLDRFLAEVKAKEAIKAKAKRIKLAELKKVEVSTPVRRYRNRKNLEFNLSPIGPSTNSDNEKSCLSDGNVKVPPRTYNRRRTKSISASDDSYYVSTDKQRIDRRMKDNDLSKSNGEHKKCPNTDWEMILAGTVQNDPVVVLDKSAIDDNEKCEKKDEELTSSNKVETDNPIIEIVEASNTSKIANSDSIDVPVEVGSTEQCEITNTIEKSGTQEEVVYSTIVEEVVPETEGAEVIENSVVSESPQRKKRSLRRSRRTKKSNVTTRKKEEQETPDTQIITEEPEIDKKTDSVATSEAQPVTNSSQPAKEDPFDMLKKEAELMPPPKGILPSRATRQTALKINDTNDSISSNFLDDSVSFVYDRRTRTKISLKRKATSLDLEKSDANDTNTVNESKMTDSIASPPPTALEVDTSSLTNARKTRNNRRTTRVSGINRVDTSNVANTDGMESMVVPEIPSSEKILTVNTRRRTTRVSRSEMKRKETLGGAKSSLPVIEEISTPAKDSAQNIVDKILDDFSVLDKTDHSEPSPAHFVTTRKRKTVTINIQPDIQEIAHNSSIVPDISTAHKKLRLSIAIGKKSVNFTVKSPTAGKFLVPTSQTEIKLHPGKWRKSLATLRKSVVNCDNILNKDRTSRRISIYVPKKSAAGDIKRLTEKFNSSLSNSIVFEQSDEENLSAITLLDESISIQKSKLHDLQQSKRFPQRQTSCFERSSIFYGIQEDTNVIDILPKLSSKQIVLRRCGQSEPLEFNDIYSESQLPYCRKIGEGVYGEVFMYQSPTTEAPVVLKIIPIEGDLLINGEPQKKFDAILSEVVITMELSNLRNGNEFMTDGFVNLQKITCVQGLYPQHLVDLWELYRDNQGTENEHPEIFQEDQLYIVLELGNAGQDLEAFKFDNAEQSYSAFLQTALTLAVAERKLEFEHRDLHWGNILIKRTDEKFAKFCIDGNSVEIPTYGVKTTIIDFTLSRMVYDGCCFFDDLAKDPELFISTGDYQFEIYRLMRDQVENQFERFEPYTNILWLHYVIDKMINGARYISSKTKKHRAVIHDMMQLRDELLDYKSTADYVKCLFN